MVGGGPEPAGRMQVSIYLYMRACVTPAGALCPLCGLTRWMLQFERLSPLRAASLTYRHCSPGGSDASPRMPSLPLGFPRFSWPLLSFPHPPALRPASHSQVSAAQW